MVMEWSLVKLLATGHISLKEGEIKIVGQRVAAVPIEFYLGLTRNTISLQEKDPDAVSRLYLNGWISGYVYMVNFEKDYKVKSEQDRYRLGMDIASFAGLGDYETTEWVPGKYSKFRILDNPIGPSLYPSKKPVDHLIRGLQGGGGSIVHHKIVQCVETSCAAVVGGSTCEMINAPMDVLEEMDLSDKTTEQINIDYVLPRQKEFVKNFGKFLRGKYNPWDKL